MFGRLAYRSTLLHNIETLTEAYYEIDEKANN
jgi:hypothetical protein